MDSLVANLSPQSLRTHDAEASSHADAAAWGSMAGFGNLDRSGAVESMAVPGVPDVSSE